MSRHMTPLEPWPFDQPLPSVMTPGELMRVVNLRHSAFCKNQKAGKYRHLEVSRPTGNQRYSGYLVDRFRRGEPTGKFGAGSRRLSA